MGFVPPYSLANLPRDPRGNRHPTGSRRIKKSMKLGNDKKRRRSLRRKNASAGSRNGILSRPSVTIARRVRTLKALIPKGESMGLEGLFREAADYIMCLEMRVRVMQMVVDALTGSSDQ